MTVDGSCMPGSPSRSTPANAGITSRSIAAATQYDFMFARASARRGFEGQRAAEERQHEVLKPDRDVAGVGARVDDEVVLDAVGGQHVVQFTGIHPQTVLVADVDGDGAVLAEVGHVLI